MVPCVCSKGTIQISLYMMKLFLSDKTYCALPHPVFYIASSLISDRENWVPINCFTINHMRMNITIYVCVTQFECLGFIQSQNIITPL